jgi:hypothetical protein
VVQGRLVNECPLNVDLAFSNTRTITLKFTGDAVEVDETDDKSILDAHNLWCLLTSLGLIGLALLIGGIFGGIGAAVGSVIGFFLTNVGPFLVEQLFSGGGNGKPTLVPLDTPVPGSDQLPTLTNGSLQLDSGALLMTATAGLRPDDVNTILYVRFLQQDGISVFTTKPVAGVTVQLLDQDVPPPPGDDPTIVVPPSSFGLHGKKGENIVNSFEPPKADQKLGEGKTDLNGVVRFALLKSQLVTNAGNIVTKTTRYDPDQLRIVTETTETPVVENEPDLYFYLTLPDGTVVDTRSMPGGFMKNFTSARIGTLAHPLTFTIGGSTGVLTQ